MPIKATCPNPACARRYSIPESFAGNTTQCLVCNQTFLIDRSAPSNGSGPIAHAAVKRPSSSHTDLQTVGRFVVRGKLGAGAFGTVYRAFDPNLNREIALKIPNPGAMDTPQRVERFLREAKAAANLRHPHIVPVFDAGQDGDHYYIASAFIDGKRLSDDVPERGMEFARAARLVRELAEALAYAHDQGIVHRDVKPQNVMLDQHDRVHLMDFGLAARHDEEARLTADGTVLGTPAYMSPEQAAGQQGEARPATDQYAAGVVLYELFTGTVPFKGPTPVVLHNVIHTEPERPRKFRADVPKDLETICLKAMAKNPDDRYEDCQELADDLRRWLEGEPISARRLSLYERATRWVEKEPKLAIGTAIILVVFVVSFVLISAFARRADTARRQMEPTLEQAKQDAVAAREAENRTADALADAQAAGKRTANALADAQAARAGEKRATNEAIGASAAVAEERKGREALVGNLANKQQEISQLQVVVELEQKKASELKGQLDILKRAWNVQAGAAVFTLKEHKGGVVSVLFSSDGLRIVTDDGKPRLWDAKNGRKIGILALKDDPFYAVRKPSLSFSAGSLRVVTGGEGGEPVRVWDGKNGILLGTLTRSPKAYGNLPPSLSPDGSLILMVGDSGGVRICDVNSGKDLFTLPMFTFPNGVTTWSFATFSPDGTRIVTTGSTTGSTQGNPIAKVWDAKDGKELFSVSGHAGFMSFASFCRDGSRVLTGSSDGTVKLSDVKNGFEIQKLSTGTTGRLYHSMSADGWPLLFAAGGSTGKQLPQVWDLKNGEHSVNLKGDTGKVTSASFSPDGTRLVTGSEDKMTKVWDVKTGDLLVTLSGHTDSVLSVSFSPDGFWIVTGSRDQTAMVWTAPLILAKQ